MNPIVIALSLYTKNIPTIKCSLCGENLTNTGGYYCYISPQLHDSYSASAHNLIEY